MSGSATTQARHSSRMSFVVAKWCTCALPLKINLWPIQFYAIPAAFVARGLNRLFLTWPPSFTRHALIIHVSFRRTSSSSAIQLAFKRGFITKETYTWLTCSQQLIPRLDVEHRRLCGESPTRIRSRSNHRLPGSNVSQITLGKSTRRSARIS